MRTIRSAVLRFRPAGFASAAKHVIRMSLAAVAVVFVTAPQAQAQQWPTRPVKVVVPYGAGGVTDTLARLTAERLSRIFGQSFVVENRPGAGGTIGMSSALREPADGYTLMFIGGNQLSVVPLVQQVTFNAVQDLVPIGIVGINGSVLAVPADAPHQTLKEFLEYARDNPGKVAYSTAGPATITHLVAALLAGRAKLEMIHVPYKSGPMALEALMSKTVQMHFGNSSDMIEPVLSGRVKALGVSTPAPMPQLPGVPPVSETIPGFELLNWNGYFAAAGTPRAIVDRISEALRKIAQDPEFVSRLRALGIEPMSPTPEEVTKIIQKDLPFFAEVVDMAGLRRN